MIQLSYQPALDPFHAAFRILRLLPIVQPINRLHRDHVRILDFYLLFPFRASDIRLAPKHRRFKRIAADYERVKPYGEQPDDTIIFARMEPMQHAALQTLAENGVIDGQQWRDGYVAPTGFDLAPELDQRVSEANTRDPELVDLMKVLSSEYDLLGQNGLKDRTGLMEYRHDAV